MLGLADFGIWNQLKMDTQIGEGKEIKSLLRLWTACSCQRIERINRTKRIQGNDGVSNVGDTCIKFCKRVTAFLFSSYIHTILYT